nr:MAG TPA: hypothetical protein [Microviridae sp.]
MFILLVNYYRLARDESALSRLALLLHPSSCPLFPSSAWGAPLGGAGTLPKSLCESGSEHEKNVGRPRAAAVAAGGIIKLC